MKALVLWAESQSKNLGVRALGEGTAELLTAAYPGIEVAFQGFGPGDAPVRIGKMRPQMLRLVSPRSELVDWVRGFDIAVDTGAGDSFADIYGRKRLITMSLMGEIVHRAKVPMVLGPQTIGPFGTRRGRLLARRALSNATVVMARDGQSAAQAASLGRPVDVLTTDVVFALRPQTPTVERDVVLNVSGLLWHSNGHVDATHYRSVIRAVCAALQAAGRRISLLAHVLDSPLADNDVPTAHELGRELAAETGTDVEVLIPTDLDDVRRMLASATVVIGSRMHACLNALSLGVPAVPLAYSRKFEPLLAALDWPYTVDLRTGEDQVERVLQTLADPAFRSGAVGVKARAEARLEAARERLAAVIR